MATREAKVPDIGNYTNVPVIEVLVKAGDTVGKDQGLVTLESDKATMEVPAPFDGVVKEVKVKVGDEVSEGMVVAVIEASDGAPAPAPTKPVEAKPEPTPIAGDTSPMALAREEGLRPAAARARRRKRVRLPRVRRPRSIRAPASIPKPRVRARRPCRSTRARSCPTRCRTRARPCA